VYILLNLNVYKIAYLSVGLRYPSASSSDSDQSVMKQTASSILEWNGWAVNDLQT